MKTRDLGAARERMVRMQIGARGVRDERVLAAMGRVPRERFVADADREHAYEDRPLPIGHGQTISQPYVAARMCELAALAGGERVLEVGAGSGYVVALLAELASEVYGVEIVEALARRARATLAALGVANAVVDCFDGTGGWPAHAPYDVIVVSAGAPRVPVLLLDQLQEDGRLVLPVGPRERQQLAVVTRTGGDFSTRYDVPVRFVDLTGRYGWGGSGPAQA